MTKANESELNRVTKVTDDDEYPEIPGEYIDPDTGEVLGPFRCAT